MTIKVEVLFSEGCLRTPLTVERVQKISQKIKTPIDLTMVQIDTYEEILEWSFIGSPTVRVNGSDIDPSARGDSFGGFT
ncbi:MAG: hypothetical protein HOD43_10245 [Candidatus Marinimicrobia bacterium]|nr:hypothetical protein [Candidatus Neomarinimicrobiota bacterium]MBT3631270.1 hypothetical protein [Candidatus Neomarinimicrobiota bacterium]MBT3824778.1 hypothetical protein [Candidatus Neomarinimicrobiota bacterium]MBT4132056.1 hypothetical protein [Candidatus Neomarinimicrobiota bacterium]MBT4296171.1 hypothetical protein [Candidatus Neomarinimicrobiota bacterium]